MPTLQPLSAGVVRYAIVTISLHTGICGCSIIVVGVPTSGLVLGKSAFVLANQRHIGMQKGAMNALSSAHSEIPTLTIEQALDALAHAHRALSILDTAYADLDQRLTDHLIRAQCLSNALAVERATRFDLQAQVAHVERLLRSLTYSGRSAWSACKTTVYPLLASQTLESAIYSHPKKGHVCLSHHPALWLSWMIIATSGCS